MGVQSWSILRQIYAVLQIFTLFEFYKTFFGFIKFCEFIESRIQNKWYQIFNFLYQKPCIFIKFCVYAVSFKLIKLFWGCANLNLADTETTTSSTTGQPSPLADSILSFDTTQSVEPSPSGSKGFSLAIVERPKSPKRQQAQPVGKKYSALSDSLDSFGAGARPLHELLEVIFFQHRLEIKLYRQIIYFQCHLYRRPLNARWAPRLLPCWIQTPHRL